MHEVYRINNVAFPLFIEQDGPENFRVTYGKQVKGFASREGAFREFGYCLAHALECDGKLDRGEE